MQALILAAGFGTRLYPITRDMPKALIKINEIPLIEYTINKLKGIREVKTLYILSNNRFYIDFLEWVDSYRKKDPHLKIKILNNGTNYDYEKRGAVEDFKLALKFMEEDDVFLLASDNIFEFELNQLINLSKEKDSSAVILRKTDDLELIKRCNHIFLEENNKIVFYEEKPKEPKSNIFSVACYFLKKGDVEKIKKHKFENVDNFGNIISFLYKESNVYGKIFNGFWADIGSKEELEKVREYFKAKHL